MNLKSFFSFTTLVPNTLSSSNHYNFLFIRSLCTQAQNPETENFSKLFIKYSQEEQNELFDHTLREMREKKIQHSANSAAAVLDHFSKNRNYNQFNKTLKEISDMNKDIKVYNSILNHYANEKDKPTFKLYNDEIDRKKIPKDEKTYETLFSWYSYVKISDKLKYYVREMGESGFQPPVAPINAYLKINQYGSVQINSIVSLLKKYNISPDITTYNRLLNHYLNFNEFSKFTALLKQMEENAAVEKTILTFNIILNYYSKINNEEGILKTYKEVEDSGLKNNITSNILFQFLCNQNDQKKIENFMNPNYSNMEEHDIVTYNIYLKYLSKQRSHTKFMDIIYEMENKQIVKTTVTYNTILHHYCSYSLQDQISKTLKNMKKESIDKDTVTYNTLLSYYNQNKKFQNKFEELLQDMVSKKIKQNTITKNIILLNYSNNSNHEKIENFLKTLPPYKKDSVFHSILLKYYSASGNQEKLEDCLIQLEKEPSKKNLFIYCNLLDYFSEQKNLKKFENIVEEMKNKKNIHFNSVVYNILLKHYYNFEDKKNFEKIAKEIEEKNIYDMITLTSLENYYDENSQDEKLQKIIEKKEELCKK